MLTGAVTVLNILLFCLSLTILYLAKRPSQPQSNGTDECRDSGGFKDKFLEIYQTVAAKIGRIGNMNRFAAKKIENATEDSIRQLSSLVERLETTRANTMKVLELMKEKISLHIVMDTVGKKYDQSSKATQEKYELVMKEMLQQLTLIIERKSEDTVVLDQIGERMKATTIQMRELTESSDEAVKSLEKELQMTNIFIENSISSLKDAMDVESRFIHSTILLLQDVVLSLVDSFIRLRATLDDTLGDSSAFGSELEEIIVNLQFEDVIKEMSQYSLEILSSIIADLHELKIDGIKEEDFIRIDRNEISEKSKASDAETEEGVTFF